jgi:hypothetical protein
MIELDNVSLGYDHRAILHNVNMKAQARPGTGAGRPKWLGKVHINQGNDPGSRPILRANLD